MIDSTTTFEEARDQSSADYVVAVSSGLPVMRVATDITSFSTKTLSKVEVLFGDADEPVEVGPGCQIPEVSEKLRKADPSAPYHEHSDNQK
jgi:hypothetical protein